MGAMLPSSRLLPATVVVAVLVLSLRVMAMATTVPTIAGLWDKGVRSSMRTDVKTASVSTRTITSEPDRDVPIQRVPAPQSRAAEPPVAPLVPPPPVIVPPSPSMQSLPIQPLTVRGLSLQGAAAPPLAPLLPVSVVAQATLPVQPSASVQPMDAPIDPPDALKVRRSQIEERERKLVEREAVMAAADKRLSERVGELTALQTRLETLESGLKERNEANWGGLVKTYEGMRPKDAALIFNALDRGVLLEILDRMKPAKATPVIAAMDPERARQITADLSAKRTRSITVTN